MKQRIQVFGLQLQPWRFAVVTTSLFIFAGTAGGAWFLRADRCSDWLSILISAQMVSFVLLIAASAFLNQGSRSWQPVWQRIVQLFVCAVVGGYLGNQLLPLLLRGF